MNLLISLFSRLQITTEVEVHDCIEFIYDRSLVHLSIYQLRVHSQDAMLSRGSTGLCVIERRSEPAISDDLITKHFISLNTFLFHLLCLRLCFKYNIYFLLKHHFLP